MGREWKGDPALESAPNGDSYLLHIARSNALFLRAFDLCDHELVDGWGRGRSTQPDCAGNLQFSLSDHRAGGAASSTYHSATWKSGSIDPRHRARDSVCARLFDTDRDSGNSVLVEAAADIISGKHLAETVRARVANAVKASPEQPSLAVVLVGEDAASQVYVRSKVKQTEAVGMKSIHHHLPAESTQQEVEALLDRLNHAADVDGILLQLPLPNGLDEKAAIEKIHPSKDVDGLTETSAGRLVQGKKGLRPCTPYGCVMLAKTALGEDLSGKHVVVIGRSILVGKRAALLFLAENCNVTLAHSRTQDLPSICRQADILVPAVGRAEMVKADWVKPGALVIDVGINRIPAPEKGEGKTRLVGDADFAGVSKVAGAITPVPGGVGPMTIACLLQNTLLAAAERRGWPDPFSE